jgi:quinol-cytochrome oxidoreductase complex cytochrome b subunit
MSIYEILPALDLAQSVRAKISIGMHRVVKFKISRIPLIGLETRLGWRTDRKFLWNPNLNEISRYIISIVPIEGAVLFELILTLLMWQNFNTKQGTQKKQQKNSRYGNPQHTYFTKFCTKELSSLRILSSLHKATKSHIFMM